jgi:WhiB family transcriptional regulator, redox-sensing transcriptional regulator
LSIAADSRTQRQEAPAMLPIETLPWAEDAKCLQADPETFFPEKGGSTREAKRICQSCDVRSECLDYALTNDERFGIWGGMSERERRKLRRMAS